MRTYVRADRRTDGPREILVNIFWIMADKVVFIFIFEVDFIFGVVFIFEVVIIFKLKNLSVALICQAKNLSVALVIQSKKSEFGTAQSG